MLLRDHRGAVSKNLGHLVDRHSLGQQSLSESMPEIMKMKPLSQARFFNGGLKPLAEVRILPARQKGFIQISSFNTGRQVRRQIIGYRNIPGPSALRGLAFRSPSYEKPVENRVGIYDPKPHQLPDPAAGVQGQKVIGIELGILRHDRRQHLFFSGKQIPAARLIDFDLSDALTGIFPDKFLSSPESIPKGLQ